MSGIKRFIQDNYRHFNAASLKDASEVYVRFINKGGKMFVAMAGAMSTAELGITLAEMIRKGKIHAICCTGANLEEDIFNLVAHKYYRRVPNYRNLSDKEELFILKSGYNRVTDTCIPEEKAMRFIERKIIILWQRAEREGKRHFPYEYIYQLIREGQIKNRYQIDPEKSWVIAACKKNLPIFTPGWEDSTLGNVFAAQIIKKSIRNVTTVKTGVEQMTSLIDWYLKNSKDKPIGFFQIGGGIAGDFSICTVPLINFDLKKKCRLWGYFCQISDSITSFGSYSGAVPNEKITWGKLGIDTPRFVIESDATIVAPLMFAYILNK